MSLGLVILLCTAYLLLNAFGEEWRVTRLLNVKSTLKPWFLQRPRLYVGVGKMCYLATGLVGITMDLPVIFVPLVLMPFTWWFSIYFGRSIAFHSFRMAMHQRMLATQEIAGDSWRIEGSTANLNVTHFLMESVASDRELRQRLKTLEAGKAGVQL